MFRIRPSDVHKHCSPPSFTFTTLPAACNIMKSPQRGIPVWNVYCIMYTIYITTVSWSACQAPPHYLPHISHSSQWPAKEMIWNSPSLLSACLISGCLTLFKTLFGFWKSKSATPACKPFHCFQNSFCLLQFICVLQIPNKGHLTVLDWESKLFQRKSSYYPIIFQRNPIVIIDYNQIHPHPVPILCL